MELVLKLIVTLVTPGRHAKNLQILQRTPDLLNV